MGGGLMQLVAYGAQDIYLTGNPQITFFKVVYRRHTNFSIEAIQQHFDGDTSKLYQGGTKSVLISRNGDLIHKMWLECKLTYGADTITAGNPSYINWTNNTGHALIEECDIEIGGQRMDKHTAQWLDIYNELTDHEESDWIGLNKHAAKNAYLRSGNLTADDTLKLYIPFQFWFCRNVGLALPLIALQYHEVKLNIKFRSIYALLNSDGTNIVDTVTKHIIAAVLYVDYIYLDTDERRRFAQVSHEYLIEQLQYTTNVAKTNLRLRFNHPIKEIIWVMPFNLFEKSATIIDSEASINATSPDSHLNDYFNYNAKIDAVDNNAFKETIGGQDSYEGFTKATIKLNGHTRFKERDASYFRLCQPRQAGHKIPTKHIYMYSFALNPEEHQPSGTCNFSRLDNAELSLKVINDSTGDDSNYRLNVYGVNYNVLRIMSGMGGLAYSN